MKTIIYLILTTSFFILISCSSEEKRQRKADKADKNYTECDTFFDEYENWVDDYIDIVKLCKAKPDNKELKKKREEMLQQISQWGLKWNRMTNCLVEQEYRNKYEKITQKLTEVMETYNFK